MNQVWRATRSACAEFIARPVRRCGPAHNTAPERRRSESEPPRVFRRLGLVLSGNSGQLLVSVVRGLELRRRDVSDRGVQAFGIPPVNP